MIKSIQDALKGTFRNLEAISANSIIDTVQNTKREWINSVVTDESVAKSAIAVLEAETSLFKSIAEVGQKYVDTLTESTTKYFDTVTEAYSIGK
ncbi:MAG: hypothetical protein QGH83_04085 [Candidatus Pacebacteria bacterium]|jgi:hypothetical protein|nr:hypothetical protein [Candidatus Paceibacterota bacterium]